MPEPTSKQSKQSKRSEDSSREERDAIYSLWRAELREAWNRRGHDGWLTATWGQPGNQRLRVYLALILRGPGQVDWGNPEWPLLEEQRLFYEPDAGEHANEEEEADDVEEGYCSSPWTDGLAGGVCGLVLALGAALSLGWIHL